MNIVKNNPDWPKAATPPRPVSSRPGLACVPRMGRVQQGECRGSLSGEKMRRGWKSVSVTCGTALLCVVLSAGDLSAEAPAASPTMPPVGSLCDEYNPFGPTRTGQIILNATDFADEDGTELLSFIETDSIGKVDVEIVSTSPARIVRAVSAVPEISTMSPNYGERLKGIKVAIAVRKTKQP